MARKKLAKTSIMSYFYTFFMICSSNKLLKFERKTNSKFQVIIIELKLKINLQVNFDIIILNVFCRLNKKFG